VNVHVPTGDKTDDVKDSLYKASQCVFDKFSKYQTNILLGDLHEISYYNGGRGVNFATFKKLIVKSTMFPHRNIYKFTLASPGGKAHIILTIF
jgi:hypothetical protein